MKHLSALFCPFALLLLLPLAGHAWAALPPVEALTFHASFDWGADADFARGDGRIYHAESMELRDKAARGLPEGSSVQVMKQGGRYEGALRFDSGVSPILFYQARGNLTEPKPGWQGTFTFWLKADPQELSAGRWVPFIAGARGKDDAAFFVEFEKQQPAPLFRMGAFPDKIAGKPAGSAAAGGLPEAIVRNGPFSSKQWTHVAIVFQGLNTGKPDGTATLYLNGKQAGFVSRRMLTFTWEPGSASLALGMGLTGWMDDFAVFNRALTAPEIAGLLTLKNGIEELHAERIPGVPPEVLRLAKKGWELYRNGEIDGDHHPGPESMHGETSRYTCPAGDGRRRFISNGLTASFDRDTGHFETIFVIRYGKLVYVGTLNAKGYFSHVSREFSHLKGKLATAFDGKRSYE